MIAAVSPVRYVGLYNIGLKAAAGAALLTLFGELIILRTGLDGFIGLVASGLPPLLALSIAVPFERRRFRSSDPALQRFTQT